MLEEELKTRIGEQYFCRFDTARIIGKIDFCVSQRMPEEASLFGLDVHSLLWAEAKRGRTADIYTSFVQLVLTIGRARTHRHYIPPKWLGAFDEEKMAFVPFSAISEVLEQNDFNWNVAPSDHQTKEFVQLYDIIGESLYDGALVFKYDTDDSELREFIKSNIGTGETLQIEIDKNNFTSAYDKWCATVKPTIKVDSWEEYNKKLMVMSADFFLADLMSDDNKTFQEKLRVLLDNDQYRVKYKVNMNGIDMDMEQSIRFSDNKKAHASFWKIFKRPPRKEYQEHILDRRDLLVPQDVREYKGAYFTPQKWVRLSQQYIAKSLGSDWQDEYYIWDCCAGTGNLLVGLTNKYKIFASTLDHADVNIMKERAVNGANLLEDNIFQFDFLNDSFDDPKVPEQLREILKSPKKRKKLVIYINPPYAEHGNRRQIANVGTNKTGVAKETSVYNKYCTEIGTAARELYIQFIYNCYKNIEGCVIANFSTLKYLFSQNFDKFRNLFRADLMSMFVVPSRTFDNVSGHFPIGFSVWNTAKNDCVFKSASADMYNEKGESIGQKKIETIEDKNFLIYWIRKYYDTDNTSLLGYVRVNGPDVKNSDGVFITINPSANDIKAHFLLKITPLNLIPMCVFFAVRRCIELTWINNQDQFLYPNYSIGQDKIFETDCLMFALFHTQNRISCENGTNHWIPFTEIEVGARREFKSHFMTDFISGKDTDIDDEEADNNDDGHKGGAPSQAIYDSRQTSHSKPVRKKKTVQYLLFDEPNIMFAREPVCESENKVSPLVFSDEALAVFDTGRELWSYYHRQDDSNPDASFYDIRKHFQGVNDKGKMNADSEDEEYMRLIGIMKEKMKFLAKKIEPKVYEYGFLR